MSARASGIAVLAGLSLLSSAACRAGVPDAGNSISDAGATTLRANHATRGIVLVANQQSANASVIDLATGVSTPIAVGNGPHEAAISADGKWGLITVYGDRTPGNQIAVIDLAAKTVVRTIDLGELRRPHGIVVLPGPPLRAIVTSEAAQRVAIVSIDEGRVESSIGTNATGSHMVAVTADGRHAFSANMRAGTTSEFDLTTGAFVRQVPIAPVSEGIAVTPDGREVWVGSNELGTVSVLDTQADSIVATIPGFRTPYRLAISPDGTLAAVCDPTANAIHVIDVATRRVLGAVSGLGSPRGVTIAPDNRTAFVTLNADNAIAVVDLRTQAVLRRLPVGTGPDGVAYTP